MSECEGCDTEIVDGARWCDSCADVREPEPAAPMPALDDPWWEELADQLEAEFPEEGKRFRTAIRRAVRKQ